jgi:small subunit ribosomal protein S17
MTDKNERVIKRRLEGVIVSDKMQKTVVVTVTRFKKHPKYLKYYKVSRRFKAHDEENVYKTGDRVLIEETRPTSKDKRWKVVTKIATAEKQEEVEEEQEKLEN